jgi:hypothetical protein
VNAGSDYDAMPDSDVPIDMLPAAHLSVPNSAYAPARILVNPRCVTTYAGVSHTQLALDLFGTEDDDEAQINATKYVLEDWDGAPESFVCQEQRYMLRYFICHSFNTVAGKLEAGRQPKPSACLDLLFMMNCDRIN